MGPKVAGAIFLVLLLTLCAEANMCKWQSQTFKGRCTHNDNCVAVCTTENATGGYCHGMIHRVCMCTKQCGVNPPPGGPPPDPPGGAPKDPPGGAPKDPPGGAPKDPPEKPPCGAPGGAPKNPPGHGPAGV